MFISFNIKVNDFICGKRERERRKKVWKWWSGMIEKEELDSREEYEIALAKFKNCCRVFKDNYIYIYTYNYRFLMFLY